jgi:hypothetical protein|tara:strand:+ start:362 stop:586 length:225 start_codon:yes stop_codon:yes gene_type:complete
MDIRKISVGPDYKDAMHYVVGQDVLRGAYKVHLIKLYDKDMSYKIWISNDAGEVVCWKGFNSTIPISIEYNIDF